MQTNADLICLRFEQINEIIEELATISLLLEGIKSWAIQKRVEALRKKLKFLGSAYDEHEQL